MDAVQRAPDLFPVLRALVDRSDCKGQFLILGSAAPALLNQVGESPLGRAATLEIPGLVIDEITDRALEQNSRQTIDQKADSQEN